MKIEQKDTDVRSKEKQLINDKAVRILEENLAKVDELLKMKDLKMKIKKGQEEQTIEEVDSA